jgi:phage head maturation protease
MKDLIRKVFPSVVKSYDDETLTIEHWISTEKVDRSKDIMVADGMRLDGIPVVLKQHGFDPDTGNEPIAKPLSITVATDDDGVKGILVKTQYFDGRKLTPPDNTGQRLYEKAKDGTMPYWSIGFRGLDAEPRTGGGMKYKEWLMFEYSQVGVPDNIGAKVKSIEEAEKLVNEKADKLLTFSIEKKEKKKDKPLMFSDIKSPDSQITKENIKDALASIEETIGIEIDIDDLKSFIKDKSTKFFKSISETVAEEIPYQAMWSIWWAFIDELYRSDGKDKTVKAIIKEFFGLIAGYADAFAKATTDEPEMFTEVKQQIDKFFSSDNEEVVDDPAPPAQTKENQPSGNPNTFKFRKSPTIRLKESPSGKKLTLPMPIDKLKAELIDGVKSSIRTEINRMKGVVE